MLLSGVARAVTVGRMARLRRDAIELVGTGALQLGVRDSAPLSRLSSRVVIEVTERSALDRVHGLTVRRSRLREHMSLVRDVDTQPKKLRVVEGIASLCAELELRVVCERVETRAELDALSGVGHELLQGYRFARPGPGFPVPGWP